MFSVFLGVVSVIVGQLFRVWNFPLYSLVFLVNEFQRRCIKKKILFFICLLPLVTGVYYYLFQTIA